MVFIVNAAGARIGYQYGSNSTIFFDDMTTSQQNIGTNLEVMYFLGECMRQYFLMVRIK